ncbi:hypothetical protein SNEBB_007257 [Seison nebaliae]|nr:hypothetical protein SNEBB_007257 [Seison nebaliae]
MEKKFKNLENFGFQIFEFNLNEYNELMINERKYEPFPSNDNIRSFLIISEPSMFEKAFLPYIFSLTDDELEEITHPINDFTKFFVEKYLKISGDKNSKFVYDFDVTPTRRPILLFQTIGHITKQIPYYQSKDVDDFCDCANGECYREKLKNLKSIFGCSSHPEFGGWFAFRAAFLVQNDWGELFNFPFYSTKNYESELKINNCKKSELLYRFNTTWQDGSYRSCLIKSKTQYSDTEKRYFLMKPGKERKEFLKKLKMKFIDLEKSIGKCELWGTIRTELLERRYPNVYKPYSDTFALCSGIEKYQKQLIVESLATSSNEKDVDWRNSEIFSNFTSFLEIGSGSGFVINSIKKFFASPFSIAIATDLNDEAVQMTKELEEQYIDVIRMNLIENIRSDWKFDLIVSNPPYVPYNSDEEIEGTSITSQLEKLAFNGGNDDGRELMIDRLLPIIFERLNRNNRFAAALILLIEPNKPQYVRDMWEKYFPYHPKTTTHSQIIFHSRFLNETYFIIKFFL